MLKPFRRCGPTAALASWCAGLMTFALTKYAFADQVARLGDNAQAVAVATPILASIIVFCLIGLIRPWHNAESDALVASLDTDLDEEQEAAAAAVRERAQESARTPTRGAV
jgi:SSS family solute:Na+ symporter